MAITMSEMLAPKWSNLFLLKVNPYTAAELYDAHLIQHGEVRVYSFSISAPSETWLHNLGSFAATLSIELIMSLFYCLGPLGEYEPWTEFPLCPAFLFFFFFLTLLWNMQHSMCLMSYYATFQVLNSVMGVPVSVARAQMDRWSFHSALLLPHHAMKLYSIWAALNYYTTFQIMLFLRFLVDIYLSKRINGTEPCSSWSLIH